MRFSDSSEGWGLGVGSKLLLIGLLFVLLTVAPLLGWLSSAAQRLAADLRRPGGGWTVGFLTLLGTMAVLLLGGAGVWPAPRWTAGIAAALLFGAHIAWGMAGYYPRSAGGRR